MKLARLPALKFVHGFPNPIEIKDRLSPNWKKLKYAVVKCNYLIEFSVLNYLFFSHMCETSSFSRRYESSMGVNRLDRGVGVGGWGLGVGVGGARSVTVSV